MTAEDILLDLQSFISQHSKIPENWHVGLAADVEEALFDRHKVDRELDSWIYRMADNFSTGRSVLESLLELKCVGEQPGRPGEGSFVYAYLKSPNPDI